MLINNRVATSYRKANKFLIELGGITQVLLLLFFRLNWGWQFFETGKGKLFHHDKVVWFFHSLHIPFPGLAAWSIGIVECIGGLCLVAGLATRPVSLLLVGNMIIAYLSVVSDRNKVFNFFNDQTPFLQADPFFFLLTALLLFSFGAGPLSLDALLETIAKRKKNKAPKIDYEK